MKNTLRIMFAVVLAFSMCVAGFALTLDTAEAATEEIVVSEEAVLAATYAPGLNVVTGTSDVVTFDEENAADYAATFTVSGGNYDSLEIGDLPEALDKDGTRGNALVAFHPAYETASAEIWHTIWQKYTGYDGERKFLYTADYAYYVGDGSPEQGAELSNRWAVFESVTTAGHVNYASSVNSWTKWNYSLLVKAGYTMKLRHRAGTGTGFKQDGSVDADVGPCKYDLYTYIDNFGIYPYYKATYIVEGAEHASEQFLLDGDGKIVTVYVPKNDNYPANTVDEEGNSIECIGWSTSPDATEPMTVVTLANEDINLYPVWAPIGIIDCEVDWIKGAGTDGEYATATVFATEGVTVDDWDIDVGNTKANVVEGDGYVTITAAGYPGEVKVTATAGDITATKVIRIVGRDAGKFIIGVDLISGTDKGWSFDNTAEENAVIGKTGRQCAYATEDNGNKYVNMAWSAADAGSDNQCYPQYIINGYPKDTIQDRPLQIKLDYMGKRGNFWILNINAATTTDNKTNVSLNNSMGNATSWTTGKYKLVAKSVNDQLCLQIGITEAQAVYKLDNFSVTPYYKVTYYDFDSNEVASEWVLPDDGILVPDLSKVDGATGFATEAGGNAIPVITLANQDIKLYAVQEDVINFVSGGQFAKVDVTTGSYTIPTAEALDMDVENFRLWTDSEGNYYYAGDVVEDASTLSGKTLTALCFKAPLAHPEKGELVYFFDYEDVTNHTTSTYINAEYANGTASRWDGNNDTQSRRIDTDGNAVVYIKGGAYQLFGYGINYNAKTVGGKATVEFDFKYISPASQYAKGSYFMRMLSHPNETTVGDPPTQIGATGDKYYNGTIKLPALRTEGFWHHAVSTQVDTNNYGLKGGIVQYQSLPTNSEQYIDNYAFYIYPAKTFAVLEEKGSDQYRFVKAEGDTYAFEAKEGVLAYTDGNNYFKVGVEYPVADLQFKVLYPYTQDASVPAVIFSYEGTTGVTGNVAQGNGASNYGENIIDEGRTVLHLHAWNKKANKDYRLIFKHAEQYDVNEYKYFQFMYKTNNVYKVDTTVAEGYSPDSSWSSAVYVNYNGDGGYYREKDPRVLYQFGSRSYTAADANDYVILEKDLSTISTIEGYPIGYGFAIDPVNNATTRWGQDIYIDYIRVYRAGVTTVTYATNAPAGATPSYEVPADENRGLGTGYLLKGLRPVVEGYTFRGWALKADATPEETVDSIDLTGDTTVYAVWTPNSDVVTPATTDKYEIRGGSKDNGIRFKSTIKASEKAGLEEFGFIATREALLPVVSGAVDTTALTFNFKKDNVETIEGSKLYVTGVAYDKDGGIDKINGEEPDGSIVYTAVTTGIPMANKKDNLVVRTYAKYTIGGNEIVVYGNTMTNSLYEVAKAIADENGEAYANNKTYIDSILAEEA